MFSDFEGKKALVTGASSGIGREIAVMLAKVGCDVAISGRNQQELSETAFTIIGHNAKVSINVADVTNVEEVKACVTTAANELSGIDIVVHCAGMTIKRKVQKMNEHEFDEVIDTNLRSTFLIARYTYPYLSECSRKGYNAKFLAIGSVGTYLGIPLSSAYCASKGGLVQFLRTIAVEWAQDNINVNAICPGYVLTPLSESVLEVEDTYSKVVSRIPMKRIGNTTDIANAALYLTSPMSDYVTGTTLNVDGGLLSCAYTIDD